MSVPLVRRVRPGFVLAVGLLTILAPTSWVRAQTVATSSLGRPTAALSAEFSSIASVRELPDGRLIVVDSRERAIKLVDFERDVATNIGRQGSGPGEYRLPLYAFAMPGDSTSVFDGGETRLLIIDPRGIPVATVSLAGLSASASGLRSRFVPTRGDAKGRLYAGGVAIQLTPQGPAVADTVPIVRWSPSATTLTTLTRIRARSLRDRGGDVDAVGALTRSLVPFVIGDQWAVDDSGRIAVLPYDEYRVDFVDASGRRVRGSPIPYERLRVSPAHRAQWRREQVVPPPFVEPPRWPEFLPPFLARPALFAPDGMLWVLRTGPAGSPSTYDIIGRGGQLVRRVALDEARRIVGFGRQWIYVVRRDSDDLQYLERYRAVR